MKKTIGFLALGIGILDLFTMIILIMTRSAVGPDGFAPLTIFCFILWFVCVVTVIICLSETVIKFIGKTFSSGYHEQIQNTTCTHCGKIKDNTTPFCPHCGTKQ